ncbi:MAG: S-layer protein [Candidatus Micrarchaeota archaeon]
MVCMRLVDEEGKAMGCREVAAGDAGVLSGERMRILRLLCEGAAYPAEIARRMGLPVQTIYYHIRLLEKAGLIDFVEYRELNGGMAKRYACRADGFAVVVNPRAWKEGGGAGKKTPRMLEPFVRNGFFDGLVVVGSPDPHGKYRARASELGALELAMYLGQHASFSFPLYALDTQVRAPDRERNLILAGGPKVNTLVAEMNDSLPIRFDERNFELRSTLSGKRYAENIGVVELVKSPFAAKKSVLVVGGLNQHGTRAAVIAIVKRMGELEKGNAVRPKTLAKVVEGFDEDGDGVVDAVEILE